MELNFKANQGQALMMMVMVMFVGLTMVLIIFMNSLSNLQLSTTEEQSERAFNISEAGIEKLLAQDVPVANLPNTADDITGVVNTTGKSEYKYTINKNDTGEIQLAGLATSGDVNIYWTNSSDGTENPDPLDACEAAGMIIEKWSMGTSLPSPTAAPTSTVAPSPTVAPTSTVAPSPTVAPTAPGCADDTTYEENDSFSAAESITVADNETKDIYATRCPSDDDYYQFSTTGFMGGTIYIDLTSLSDNLDVTLYNVWNIPVKTSANTGLLDEHITSTYSLAGLYKIKVFGSTADSNTGYTLSIKYVSNTFGYNHQDDDNLSKLASQNTSSSVLGAQTGAVLGVCTGVTTQEAGSAYKVTRYVYQPYGCSDSLTGIQGQVWEWANSDPGNVFLSMATIPVTSDDIMLRVRPIYNKATIQALGPNANFLPIQLHNIESSAQVDVSGEARALQVVRTVPQLPSIFDYVLFSGEEAIVKE